MSRLIIVLAVLIGVAACSKNSSSKPSLTGNWKQIEYFDGSSGGCNCWKTTANDFEVERIEFRSNGTFQRRPPMIYSFLYCPGEYRVVNDSILVTTMICSGTGPAVPPPVEETHGFSKQANFLTIDWRGTTGWNRKIKYKKED